MKPKPSALVLKMASEAIDLAMECVATGETLLPFVITEGSPGRIVSLSLDGFDEVLAMAQETVDSLEGGTRAFAFAYDGFIAVEGERSDAIYVEAAEVGGAHIHLFAQRYRPKRFLRPVKRIGNLVQLDGNEPRLKREGGTTA
jgi:hypothetical protein